MSQPETSQHSLSRLLLVDDDPAVVRLLQFIVRRSLSDRVTVESVTNPHEAIARINSNEQDIILTDFEMPGVDGLELLRLAKQRNPCTQVLFITGNSTQQALLKALSMGASDYMLKPVNQDTLLELITQAADRQRRWRRALAETWRSNREQEHVTLDA